MIINMAGFVKSSLLEFNEMSLKLEFFLFELIQLTRGMMSE